MSLPFFDVLAAAFPHSRIDIIAKETIQEVFLHHPDIHAIHPFSKKQYHGIWGLSRYGRLLKSLGPYDVFMTLAPSFSSAFMGYSTGCGLRVGYTHEARSWLFTHSFSEPHGIHRTYAFCHLLHVWLEKLRESGQPLPFELAPREEAPVQAIRFPFSAREQQTVFLPKTSESEVYIVFNVNSEAQSRRLPFDTWIELGNRLLDESNPTQKISVCRRAGRRTSCAAGDTRDSPSGFDPELCRKNIVSANSPCYCAMLTWW